MSDPSNNGTSRRNILEVIDENEGMNSHVQIIGTSRAAKTDAARTLLNRAFWAGSPVCIIDAHGQHSDFARESGGRVESFESGEFNLSGITSPYRLDQIETYEITKQTARFLTVCGLPEELQSQFTKSFSTYMQCRTDHATPMPTSLPDFLSYLSAQRSYNLSELSEALREILARDLPFSLAHEPTAQFPDDPIISFDLSQIPRPDLDATTAAVLNYYWSHVQSDYAPTGRVLLIENADHLIVDRELNIMLLGICKRARHYRLAVVTTVQSAAGPNPPSSLIRNHTYHLLTRQSGKSTMALIGHYGVSDEYQQELTGYTDDEALLLHPSHPYKPERVSMKPDHEVVAAPADHDHI